MGKSSLLNRLRGEEFGEAYTATIGVDFFNYSTSVEGKDVTLQIWDTAGQERFMAITSTFFRGAHGVLIVYDVTSRQSFESVQRWFHCIAESNSSGMEKVVVGNKCDLAAARQVSTAEGLELAQTLGLPSIRFFESSAKTGDNATEVFTGMAKHLVQLAARDEAEAATVQSAVDLQNAAGSAPRGGCC